METLEQRSVNPDELQELQEIEATANALHQNIGMAIHQIELWKTECLKLDSRKRDFHEKLTRKYSIGKQNSINLTDGTIG